MKNKLLKIALAIVAGALFFSCGSRKVNKQVEKQKEEVNTSVVTNEKVKDSISYHNEEKLRLKLEKTNLNFEPIDNTKPFFIGSQKYENVKVVSNTEKLDFEKDKKEIEFRLIQQERHITLLQDEIKENYKKIKQTERDNTKLFVIIFVILLLLLLAIIYYYYRQYKGKKDTLTKTFNL